MSVRDHEYNPRTGAGLAILILELDPEAHGSGLPLSTADD